MINRFEAWLDKIFFVILRKWLRWKPSDEQWEASLQFVKFGIVGVLNNLISYGTYLALWFLGVHYMIANIIGFSVSVFNSYYWNNKYVFSSDKKRVWWKTFFKTYISYAGTGIILSNILLFLWVDKIGISAIISPIINLIITVPINFVVNKFWAYKN